MRWPGWLLCWGGGFGAPSGAAGARHGGTLRRYSVFLRSVSPNSEQSYAYSIYGVLVLHGGKTSCVIIMKPFYLTLCTAGLG